MKKTTVLYHADADGFGAAFAVWLEFRDRAHYISVQYSQPVPEIPEGTEHLIIVDFSYKREICEELAAKYRVLIIDHHKTAEAELAELDYALFDAGKSGCGLAWEYFHGTADVPEILKYIQDRDLWKFDMPYSKEVNLFIATLEWDFDLWYRWAFSYTFTDQAIQAGTAIEAYQDGLIKGAMRGTRILRLSIEGTTYEVPVLNCSSVVSEVGNELCREYPDAPFSATYCDRKDVRSWSLRSIGDFDVSTVARAFGGGGHKNAAGFATDIGWPQITPDEFLQSFEEASDEIKTV